MEFKTLQLGDIILLEDKKRKPLSTMDRSKRKGIYPYYGAQEIIDSIDDYIFDGKYILLAEDGENLKSRKKDLVKIVEGKFWLNNHAHIFKTKEDVDLEYLYYYLLKLDLSEYITGSTQPKLNQENMNKIKIKLPNLDIQKKISRILSKIDEKIKVNNDINNNLSEQLKTVFYEWFESKINETLPETWVIANLQNVSIFSQGVQVPIEEQVEYLKDGFVRFIRIVDITQGSDKEIRYIENRDRGHVAENEIFMTRYGTPGILSRNYNGILANNLFKISALKGVTSNYLFSALNVDRIQSYIRGNATSSTMPAISFTTLYNQKIVIPDKELLEKFDKYSEIIRLIQLNIINENKKLHKLRNALLPKLMNGEIDLDKIEI